MGINISAKKNKAIVELIAQLRNSQVVDSETSKYPKIISNQVEKLVILGNKVDTVVKEAERAKKAAEKANKEITFFGGRKEAIEQLQKSGRSIASAVQGNAKAHQVSFEFQKELADISKYLFGLGATNMTNNRIVVRQLELKMKGASKAEISDLAKQELYSVLRQLKAQEDILKKLGRNTDNLRDLKKWVNIISEDNEKLKEELFSIAETTHRQDVEIKDLTETCRSYDAEVAVLVDNQKYYKTELTVQKEHHEQEITGLINHNEHLNKKINIILAGLIITVVGYFVTYYFMI